ncbi:amidohydrolase family protein [Thiolapillus sp.]|uniref:amidohydrolase family protein n=11 Tax=Thiolapillus sp. TaxID=2017437 RepID=UPI0025DB9661|nr:amidohydrolase family protein [Thiolapillus sp.]
MKTVDTHTHLLSRDVRFDRLFDKIAVRFFARNLGVDPTALKDRPWETYVQAMAEAVRNSTYVEKTCLFGVDSRVDARGRETHRDRTVCAGNSDVIEVAHRYPDQFIPFFSINPLRPDALDLIDEYVEKGCAGAKFLQNYWQVDLNDEALVPYYRKLRDLRLPLIVHIGSEFAIESKKQYEGSNMLRLPLQAGVTVIAAHMGLGQIGHWRAPWRNLSQNPVWFDRDYFHILEMLEVHENLYGDLSAMLLPLRARALKHLAGQQQVHHKLLFGTDYPVPFTIRFNTHRLEREEKKRIAGIQNPFDRYAAALLSFFPEDNPLYTNHQRILTPPHPHEQD